MQNTSWFTIDPHCPVLFKGLSWVIHLGFVKATGALFFFPVLLLTVTWTNER